MSMTDFPSMLVSETAGWADIDRAHRTRGWYRWAMVVPLSMLPPLFYVYAQLAHPGVIFPLTVPGPTAGQLFFSACAFYVAELVSVTYLAMLIQRMAMARDHDPGDDGPYALATIAILPFWIGSVAMAVPSLGFNVAVLVLAAAASILLLRHGTKPLLHIDDERIAHYVADTVTLAGFAAWVGVMLLTAFALSVLLVQWTYHA